MNAIGGLEIGPGSLRQSLDRAVTCRGCGARWEESVLDLTAPSQETGPSLLDPNLTSAERRDDYLNWGIVISGAAGYLVTGGSWWGPLLGWALALALILALADRGLASDWSVTLGGSVVVFAASGYLLTRSWWGAVGGGVVLGLGLLAAEGVQSGRRRERLAAQRASGGPARRQRGRAGLPPLPGGDPAGDRGPHRRAVHAVPWQTRGFRRERLRQASGRAR